VSALRRTQCASSYVPHTICKQAANLLKDWSRLTEQLARRIASFPPHTVGHLKVAMDRGAFDSVSEGLRVEAHESDLSVASDVTKARIKEVLKLGFETYQGWLHLDYLTKLSPIR